MFHSHLIYFCQIWGQNNTILRKLEPLQNKDLRIIKIMNTMSMSYTKLLKLLKWQTILNY